MNVASWIFGGRFVSLFDPNTSEERLQQLATGGWWNGSGQPIPPFPDLEVRHLEDELLTIGLKVIGSPDRASGWDDAYAAFVNAFLRTGATLTQPLLHVDIPNMLFNFGLRNGWFPHLTILEETKPGHLLAPKRIPIGEFATTGPVFSEVHNKRQQLGWFKDRIRNAVHVWTIKAKEILPESDSSGTASSQDAPGQGSDAPKRTHWLQKQLALRGWSTLTLYGHLGPDRKTSEGYIAGKNITANSLKKIVDALNSEIPPEGSKLDINTLPD